MCNVVRCSLSGFILLGFGDLASVASNKPAHAYFIHVAFSKFKKNLFNEAFGSNPNPNSGRGLREPTSSRNLFGYKRRPVSRTVRWGITLKKNRPRFNNLSANTAQRSGCISPASNCWSRTDLLKFGVGDERHLKLVWFNVHPVDIRFSAWLKA